MPALTVTKIVFDRGDEFCREGVERVEETLEEDTAVVWVGTVWASGKGVV